MIHKGHTVEAVPISELEKKGQCRTSQNLLRQSNGKGLQIADIRPMALTNQCTTVDFEVWVHWTEIIHVCQPFICTDVPVASTLLM